MRADRPPATPPIPAVSLTPSPLMLSPCHRVVSCRPFPADRHVAPCRPHRSCSAPSRTPPQPSALLLSPGLYALARSAPRPHSPATLFSSPARTCPAPLPHLHSRAEHTLHFCRFHSAPRDASPAQKQAAQTRRRANTAAARHCLCRALLAWRAFLRPSSARANPLASFPSPPCSSTTHPFPCNAHPSSRMLPPLAVNTTAA